VNKDIFSSSITCQLSLLHRCLISSSQIAWQNSEVTANIELLQLCSLRDSPWRWRCWCYYGDKWSQNLLTSHLHSDTSGSL